MMKLAVSIAFAANLLGGCLMPDAKAPHSGAVATGEQLAVVDDVKVWTTTQKEKVGETEYKDSSGATIATANTYADKTTTHTMKIWYPVQGKEQLSDEDFFRITKEDQALAETEALRANGKKWNHRGIGLLIGGAVGVLGSYFIDNTAAKEVLEIGGAAAVAGGYYAAYWGAKQMDPETHAVDRSVADRAAQQYNQNLGHTVGFNVGKSF